MKKISVFITFVILTITISVFYGFQNKQSTPAMIELNNDDYEAAWKIIDSLERQGLPKSALEKVEALYQRATQDKNPSQIIKTVIFRSKYMNQLEEDGLVRAVGLMKSEMEKAEFPVKPILQSMMAEGYSTYLNNNYWKFRNRTETPTFKTDDIQTWTINQLLEESRKLYLASLDYRESETVKIEDFTAILSEGRNEKGLRPTLFDFLAHRAIDHFKNARALLNEPAYNFVITEKEAFAEATSFVNYNFETKDINSSKYQTVLLFQKLIKTHLKDSNPAPLIDADLKRLSFMNNHAVLEDKETVYRNALETLQKKYIKNPASAEISHLIALIHFQKGQEYSHKEKPELQFEYKKAYEICEKAIKAFPESYGAKNCKSLQANILRKNLVIQTELVNLPNEPFLGHIEYKNVSKLWFRLIKITPEDRFTHSQLNRKAKIAMFKKMKPLRTWNLDLPNDGDYQSHSVEFKMDALPLGTYLILASDNDAFNDEGNAVFTLYTNISNLSFWNRAISDGGTSFAMVHRKTGDPLANVDAQFYIQKYNQKTRKREYINWGKSKSDANGFMNAPENPERNFRVKLSLGDDVLYLDDSYYNYNRSHSQNTYQTSHFFLDRAIYRPGQTVYFKALAIETGKDKMPTILANKKVELIFRDANHQEIEKLELKTNEFGTVNGSFTAPRTGLLGQMSIHSSIGGNTHYFRVEEYKRPKFEVTFDPVKEGYRLEEEVTVKGKAKAFAGSNVDGAKVKYRVVRNVSYPYYPWWRYGRGYRPYGGSTMEIINGETTTDETGAFEIKFNALADKSIDQKNKPQFNFQVSVDVVDITGETRSNSTSVSVGYVALDLSVAIAAEINRDSLKKIILKSKNLNGEFEQAKGKIEIASLTSPGKIFRHKFWSEPDRFILTKEEYNKNFPHDYYKEENQFQNWPVGKSVYSINFDTKEETEPKVNGASWPVGSYVMTVSSEDKYGTPVELKKYFTLYDLEDKKAPETKIAFSVLNPKIYEPGQTAKVLVGSPKKPIQVLFEVEHDGEIVRREWHQVDGIKEVSISIEEKHRGNLHYYWSFVKDNRSYNQSQVIQVPWTNKELSFEYSTFRDKLYPGQKEEWRIKISGDKKEKVAAEMLAGMYDASLDAFAPNNWYLNLYPTTYQRNSWQVNNFTNKRSNLLANNWNKNVSGESRYYQGLNWFNFQFYQQFRRHLREQSMKKLSRASGRREKEAMMDSSEDVLSSPAPMEEMEAAAVVQNVAVSDGFADDEVKEYDNTEKQPPVDFSDVKIRTNLNETVFFFPNLMTDEDGNIIVKFTMNEALTRWKFLGLAHTKDLKVATTTKEVVTQKDLMVLPNAPRFVREGDEIEFTAKVSNLTKTEMNGSAVLELFDALTMEPVDLLLDNKNNTIPFLAKAGQSAPLSWKLKVPTGKVMALMHRVVAKAGKFSDGEESSIPVLSNRMLVTETKPLPIRGKQTKSYTFKAMEKAAKSNTLQHHKLTMEFTSNPAWYAVQALPYMMDYPYKCTEQIFSRYYANSLATSVANSHPKVKRVFDQWKNTDALESNLTKNQDLKSALLEETPWVLQAQSEAQQKRNIGLLFDLNRMSYEQEQAITTLVQRQQSNGGFSWFPDGRDSWYITQYLLEGMGHLNELGVKSIQEDPRLVKLSNQAIKYIDDRVVEHYEKLEKRVKEGKTKFEDDHLSSLIVHYLYTRSFYPSIEFTEQAKKVHQYYLGQADQYWLNRGPYQEGMIALGLHRAKHGTAPAKIVKSLKERSLNNEEMGMYWKYDQGYYWYQLPIETHALMIEVFDEVAGDEKAVDDLKVWLLKTKQTTHWKTTKATSAAVYALLRRGDNWLLEDQPLEISIGGKTLDQSMIKKEAGTGYFKTSWNDEDIKNNMSEVKITNPNNVVAWGAMYWQYFEQLDKIETFEETPLTIVKQLFREENSDRGPIMKPIAEGNELIPGDKVKVRIELRVDRPMEYVHMKDMRASGFEPLNVLSSYKWQGGLGYYESTKDASTNFFFSYLPKGTYVFEYPLRVNHKGDFSNGITTVQCMYAPEFSSHSEGIRVKVK